MLESRQTHDTGFVHAHGIAAKVLDEALLYHAELFHFCSSIHEVVNVQRFLCPYDHGGRQRKRINLFLLLFKAAVIHLEELCVDPRDGRISLSAVVDDEENPSLHGIVVFERFLDVLVFPTFAGQLRPLENARLFVLKYAKADCIRRIEERTENIHRCYIHAFSSPKYRSVFFIVFASLISSAMPDEISPNTQTSSQIPRSAIPNICPILRSSGLVSSSICG